MIDNSVYNIQREGEISKQNNTNLLSSWNICPRKLYKKFEKFLYRVKYNFFGGWGGEGSFKEN